MEVIRLYTDGGCRGNGKEVNVGGAGIIFLYGPHRKEYSFGLRNITNNIMEMEACIEGLKAITRKDIPVHIYTDSQYVCNAFNKNWLDRWKRNGWKNKEGRPVANKDRWVTFSSMVNQFDSVTFHWVKGHNGNTHNERADVLANEEMDKLEEVSV